MAKLAGLVRETYFRGGNWEQDPKRGFASVGELFRTLALHEHGQRDERVASLWSPGEIKAAAGSDEQGAYDVRYGGYAIPRELAGFNLGVSALNDPAAATFKLSMPAPEFSIPARTDKDHTTSVAGGITFSRRAETLAIVSSRMEMELVSLKAHSVFGLTYVTEELAMDGGQAFAALLERGYRDAGAAIRIREICFGKGGNEFLGALVSDNASRLLIAKETSQTPATINYQNVSKIAERVWGFDESAVWLANFEARTQLHQVMVPAMGSRPGYEFAKGDGERDRLLGRPVFYSEEMKALGSEADIACCNWTEFLEATLEPFTGASSMHVRYVEHERAFKFWTRNAGAPWWRAPLTPRNKTGAFRMSPFVTLAARS